MCALISLLGEQQILEMDDLLMDEVDQAIIEDIYCGRTAGVIKSARFETNAITTK